MVTVDAEERARYRVEACVIRGEMFAIRYAMQHAYDRRPEKRREEWQDGRRLPMSYADGLETHRAAWLLEEFSPSWTGQLGVWPDGRKQK